MAIGMAGQGRAVAHAGHLPGIHSPGADSKKPQERGTAEQHTTAAAIERCADVGNAGLRVSIIATAPAPANKLRVARWRQWNANLLHLMTPVPQPPPRLLAS